MRSRKGFYHGGVGGPRRATELRVVLRPVRTARLRGPPWSSESSVIKALAPPSPAIGLGVSAQHPSAGRVPQISSQPARILAISSTEFHQGPQNSTKERMLRFAPTPCIREETPARSANKSCSAQRIRRFCGAQPPQKLRWTNAGRDGRVVVRNRSSLALVNRAVGSGGVLYYMEFSLRTLRVRIDNRIGRRGLKAATAA